MHQPCVQTLTPLETDKMIKLSGKFHEGCENKRMKCMCINNNCFSVSNPYAIMLRIYATAILGLVQRDVSCFSSDMYVGLHVRRWKTFRCFSISARTTEYQRQGCSRPSTYLKDEIWRKC